MQVSVYQLPDAIMASGRPTPWNPVNQHNSSLQNNFYSSSNIPGGFTSHLSGGGGGRMMGSSGPPPLPPRPNASQTNRMPLYGTSSTYTPYGLYGTSYNPYMPYHSGMNYAYNSYGSSSSNGMNYNSLYQQVENSSRSAFQSIESIVQAFTSVSMMLDSTFQALYSSFRAVIGVADNLSRLKSQICHMVSALAVIRTLRYLVRKVLEILRLSPPGQADMAWKEAVGNVVSQEVLSKNNSHFSSWPIIMFFGIIIGAPWLIWKLISPNVPKWLSGEDEHYVSVGLYNFQAENPDELSFSAGQKIIIAPKDLQPRIKGWFLASVDGKKAGIVPVNYLKEPVYCKGRRNVEVPGESPCNNNVDSAVNTDTQSETFQAATPDMDNVFNSYFKLKSDT